MEKIQIIEYNGLKTIFFKDFLEKITEIFQLATSYTRKLYFNTNNATGIKNNPIGI